MSNERRRRQLFIALAVLIAVATLAYLASGGIGENLVYYWSPSELRDAGSDAVGASIRLGGLVAPGSIDRGSDGLTLRFAVTDGQTEVPVNASAVPPAMFREGIGVVVEGTMREDGTFETRRLMVKHDNEYRAPTEGETADMEKLMQSMQFEKVDG
jgi:cytochrome c-type biogenesis protein CcmE